MPDYIKMLRGINLLFDHKYSNDKKICKQGEKIHFQRYMGVLRNLGIVDVDVQELMKSDENYCEECDGALKFQDIILVACHYDI